MDHRPEDEDKIVWLKDRDALAKMGYVQEKWLLCPIRTGPVRAPAGEALIGYAVLKKTAAKEEEGGFYRRIFTRSQEERQKGEMQPTAVDPLTVEVGKPGRCVQPQR
jgi:hypothetical protein